MTTPAEIEEQLRKILHEEYPSIAKYVQFKQKFCSVRFGIWYYHHETAIPHDYDFYIGWFRDSMGKVAKEINGLTTYGEQICSKCSHELTKYRYLPTVIAFHDFSKQPLPRSMRCRHAIRRKKQTLFYQIELTLRHEHLCRQLRVLPLPIANEIIEYIKK